MKRAYHRYRRLTLFVAFGTVMFSVGLGCFAFFGTTGSEARFSAAGQVAAVVPGFAGVLLAAFALSAYLREEDEVVKASEAAWTARNNFLLFSDILYSAISYDVEMATDLETDFEQTRKALRIVWPSMRSALFGSDLARALVMQERSRQPPRKKIGIALGTFLQSAEELASDGPIANVQASGGWFLAKWWTIAAEMRDLQDVGNFEKLLSSNYTNDVPDELRKLMEDNIDDICGFDAVHALV